MSIKYKKYKKLIHLIPEEEIMVEGRIRDFGHTIIFKIKGEKQEWIFERKDFAKFYQELKK